MNRFEPVPDIRQRPADNHTHRIVEIGLLEFVLNTDRDDFLGDITHLRAFPQVCTLTG